MSNFAQTAKKELNEAANHYEGAKRNAREVAEEAGSKVRQFLHDTSEQAAELRKNTEEKITEHPLKSVALAGLAGLVLGALIRR